MMIQLRTTIFISLMLIMGQTICTAAEPVQSVESIRNAIGAFINKTFKDAKDFEVSLSHLDSRLRLPLCDQPLHLYSQTGSLKAGSNAIGVHCETGQKWTIYTIAQIKAFQKVLVLAQPLRRGDIVSPKHLILKRRDIADFHRGYLLDPKAILHKQAKRNLAAGTVVSGANFTEPTLIKRGEKVKIEATSPYFNISMKGVAMMDGHKGQHIQVRNVRSKRIIQATVVESGLVSVN